MTRGGTRVCQKINVSISGEKAIVPVTVECVSAESEFGHLLIGNLDTRRIDIRVQITLDRQAAFRGGACDQVDNDLVADQRLATPVLTDEGN